MRCLEHAILGVSETRWTVVKWGGPFDNWRDYSILVWQVMMHHMKKVRWCIDLIKGGQRITFKEWEPMSERIISARFKCQNTTIFQVYTPTNEAEE